MALKNTDLFAVYRESDSTAYNLKAGSLQFKLPDGSDTDNILVWDGAAWVPGPAIDTLVYRGTVDVTVVKPIAFATGTPVKQDFYVNVGQGSFHSSWADVTDNATTATEANPGDFMIYDQTSYDYVPAGAPPASDGLWVESGNILEPVNPDAALDGGEYAT
jgi:hypothetical protein